MQLKVFSKFDCFLKLGFRKLEFQPKIKFLKLDLDLTWIKKKKKKKKSGIRVPFKKNNGTCVCFLWVPSGLFF